MSRSSRVFFLLHFPIKILYVFILSLDLDHASYEYIDYVILFIYMPK
jgi:hypothetical protein